MALFGCLSDKKTMYKGLKANNDFEAFAKILCFYKSLILLGEENVTLTHREAMEDSNDVCSSSVAFICSSTCFALKTWKK